MPELPKIDIRPDHWRIVSNILQKHVPQYAVWAFGSRAKWTAKQYSDLDLAIITDKPLSLDISTALSDDFSESDLPWRVDIVDWASTSEAFRKVIARDKVVIHDKKINFSRLGDIADIVDSLHKTPKYTSTGNSMVRCTDVKYGPLKLDKTFKVDSSVFAEFSRRYTPSKGDIIITRVGSYGNSAYVEDANFCLGQNTSAIIPKINSRFLFYALNSLQVKNQIEFSVVGSTQKTLSLKAISDLEIPRLSFEIEEAIAQIGSHLDDRIQLNCQVIVTSELIAQAIFKSWFIDFDPVTAKIEVLQAGGSKTDAELAAMAAISGNSPRQLIELKEQHSNEWQQLADTAALFPSAMQESELGEIPEGWLLLELKDIAIYTKDRIKTAELSIENYISTENMLENKAGVTFASSLPSVTSVPKITVGDILVSNIRPYFKKIWLSTFTGGRSADVLGFRSIIPEHTEYLFNLIYQDSFFNFMMTTSKGAKMPRGDKDAIMGQKIVVPVKLLRDVYSEKVRALHKIRSPLVAQNNSLKLLRDTLLPKLLSGELQIADVQEQCKDA